MDPFVALIIVAAKMVFFGRVMGLPGLFEANLLLVAQHLPRGAIIAKYDYFKTYMVENPVSP